MNSTLQEKHTCNKIIIARPARSPSSFLGKHYHSLPPFRVQYTLKTWSDIVSDQPMFLSDMIGHLIILKRDVVSCHSTIKTKTVTNTYQKSKTICIMVNKITQYQRQTYSVTVYIILKIH